MKLLKEAMIVYKLELEGYTPPINFTDLIYEGPDGNGWGGSFILFGISQSGYERLKSLFYNKQTVDCTIQGDRHYYLRDAYFSDFVHIPSYQCRVTAGEIN